MAGPVSKRFYSSALTMLTDSGRWAWTAFVLRTIDRPLHVSTTRLDRVCPSITQPLPLRRPEY